MEIRVADRERGFMREGKNERNAEGDHVKKVMRCNEIKIDEV